LKGDEPANAEGLLKARAFTGETLRGFKDTDNPDFIDSYNRTYDAVGGPTAWASPLLNMTRMLSQIHRHIYEKDGVDFTVVDLTGASSTQIGEVFDNIDKWAADPAVPAATSPSCQTALRRKLLAGFPWSSRACLPRGRWAEARRIARTRMNL
jgi:hypothetical protein